ncbi:unnamed protein product [Ectocarpus sp. CCAP 1310/34]|nr:unnamed protein product [Ectocarpus sp. CCAP 1310/34]
MRSAGASRSALGGGDKESVAAAALLSLHALGVQEGPAVLDHDAGFSRFEHSPPLSRITTGCHLPLMSVRFVFSVSLSILCV